MKLNHKTIGYIVAVVVFILINVFVVRAIIKGSPKETEDTAASAPLLGTPAQIGTLSLIGTPPRRTPTVDVDPKGQFSTPPASFTATPALPTFTPLPSQTPSPTISSTIPNLEVSGYDCLPTNTQKQLAQVEFVIDGSTIEVTINDRHYVVRYIGIDAPGVGEPLYKEALKANQKLVEDQIVILIADTLEEDQDEQLLRYVFISPDFFVNYELVKEGMGTASTIPPNNACAAYFLDAQRIAANREIGIWDPNKNPATQTPRP